MNISLSVKIIIKDFFPKNENISYDNYICLFTYNNFNGKINLKNIYNQNQNSIRHKVYNFNSNIIYEIHLFDTNKNSLVGISQLIIYFDKIKNLNVNDTLTQEEKVKLIIDSKTKRKIFNKIYNIGDIFLHLLTEIKIIDKKSVESSQRYHIDYNIKEKELICNTNNNINNNIIDFSNLTPRDYQKKEDIKSIKIGRGATKRVDTFSDYRDLNLADLSEESLKNSTTSSLLQKNKSLQKLNKQTINKKNKKSLTNNNNKSNNINDKYKRHRSINSCIEIPLSLHNKTNYNLGYNKEDKKKSFLAKSYRKNQIPKKKVTILNLMEEKIRPILYKQNPKDVNYYELNNQFKEFRDFKNTSINFSKIQINKINDNLKIYSSRTVNKHKSFKSKEKIKKNLIEEIEYNQKMKNIPKSRKIMVNKIEKNKDIVKDTNTISSHKSENGREIKCKKIKKLSIFNTDRLNTEMNMNNLEIKNNNNLNLNSAILQTEIYNRKLSEMKINLRKNKNKHILTDLDLEQLIIEKGATIKGNFQDNCLRRGAFSPKLQLKFKFNENALLNKKNDITDYKFEPDKNTYRYKDKISTGILTPKANPKKLNSFNNNNLCFEDNYYLEKEEIKKRYINLIDFYSLLSKKMKKNKKNNIEIAKNFENIKEKYTYLQKQKNKLIQKLNSNESKRIKNKAFLHFEQEQLFDKIMNIKIKENSVYQNIFGPEYGSIEMQNKIEDLILQKKELMLNLIKNIVKFYGNISQIYNNDINKKNILKTLLNKYNIKEKVKIDLNYISNIHKENNFEDKIITEVDEEKENEEDEEENKIQQDGENNFINNNEQIKTSENNINENNNNNVHKKILDNKIEKDTYNEKDNNQDMAINTYNDYDENLNNLIKKILIEQFPENYKTNMRFNHIEKNKYSFGNKIFLGYIDNNDVVLKEEINENIISDNKYTLNEFYHKYCFEGKKKFVYTKKIRQKYIKIKNNNDKEQSLDKKPKNENSTTISDNEKRQQSILSKLNDMGEMKNSMSEEKETV